MLKIVKSNIEARKISLTKGSNSVALFQNNTITSNALYLKQHEQTKLEIPLHQTTLLYVVCGMAELKVAADNDPLHLQLMQHDVLLLPEGHTYHISNITEQECTLCITNVCTT